MLEKSNSMIKGKVRNMYFGRKIFFCFFGLLLGFQCIRASITSEAQVNIEAKAFWPGILFLVFTVFSFLSIFYDKQNLTVAEKIVFKTKFSTRKIQFSDIVNIEYRKIIQIGKSGRLTDGYTEAILILKNTDQNLIISPDVFENYNEVMFEIKSRISQKHEA